VLDMNGFPFPSRPTGSSGEEGTPARGSAYPGMRVGVDVGGTFTDLVARNEDGNVVARIKVPSTPSAPERGVIAALDALLAAGNAEAVTAFAHSTTIATNALLGQIGLELPRVALVATEGFTDVIEIARQNRSAVYDLNVVRPRPLVAREDRVGIRERMDFRGTALVPLERDAIDATVAAVAARAPASVAVALLHAYANPAHERALGDALRAALPAAAVTLSCDVDCAYREYERTSTTVVNAALLPLVRGYLERLGAALRERGIAAPLYVMQSNGGMSTAATAGALPASIIESGPAAGVIATAALARQLGIGSALAFDMGGTTAKAGTIVDGVPQHTYDFEVAGRAHSGRAVRGSGYVVRFPALDLAEVSAGGGTIAYIDQAQALRVGPLSAGADPGPAAYGKSDRPTVTDANLVLGRLSANALLGGAMPVDGSRARAAVASLLPAMRGLSLDETAAGIVALVDHEMAKVLRIVTVERGFDPRAFTLVAYGGGGPMHACAVADELSIARIVVPADPGLFSAHGLLGAELRASTLRALATADAAAGEIEALFAGDEVRAREALVAQGAAAAAIATKREADARYAGQSFELTIPAAAPFDEAALRALQDAFHARHEQVYGFSSPAETVELVNVRCTARAPVPSSAQQSAAVRAPAPATLLPVPREHRSIYFAYAGRRDAPVYARAALGEGSAFAGPALVEQYDACTLVAPGWHVTVAGGNLLLERA
jgi:N-methylhydantoinase A